MDTTEIRHIIETTDRYNFHSHTEYCDGHAPVGSIVEAACAEGFEVWGVTPHSPINVESQCNMLKVDVPNYIHRIDELKERYEGRMRLMTGMEIDFMSRDFGPHIDYFQKLSLEYRIGSVHFVPTQEGVPLDCDGSYERFSRYLKDGYGNDLRYVVEKYFEQVLTMLELGGFEMLGHFDKIIGNAALADPEIENQGWYAALVSDVIRLAKESGVIVEINTKALKTKNRFFPADHWWRKLIENKIPLAINSDCHDPALTDLGRKEAFHRLAGIQKQVHE